MNNRLGVLRYIATRPKTMGKAVNCADGYKIFPLRMTSWGTRSESAGQRCENAQCEIPVILSKRQRVEGSSHQVSAMQTVNARILRLISFAQDGSYWERTAHSPDSGA